MRAAAVALCGFTMVACGLFGRPCGGSLAMESADRRYDDGVAATSANVYDFNSPGSTARRPAAARNPLEDINIKELLETLSKLGRTAKHETETTSSASTRMNMFRKLDNTKYDNNEDDLSKDSNRLVTDLAILDKAYAKVSDRIKSVHDSIQKDFDVMMKLNILKGMLMEENIQSKGSEPWIKYMSKYKNFFPDDK